MFCRHGHSVPFKVLKFRVDELEFLIKQQEDSTVWQPKPLEFPNKIISQGKSKLRMSVTDIEGQIISFEDEYLVNSFINHTHPFRTILIITNMRTIILDEDLKFTRACIHTDFNKSAFSSKIDKLECISSSFNNESFIISLCMNE